MFSTYNTNKFTFKMKPFELKKKKKGKLKKKHEALPRWFSLRLCAPNAGDLGSIPGQRTRSHMLQLSLRAATETSHSLIS